VAAAKKRGVKLGGLNAKGIAERQAARERAEQLRPLFAELAGLSARKAAEEPNRRSVATPAGGKWHAATVLGFAKDLHDVVRIIELLGCRLRRDVDFVRPGHDSSYTPSSVPTARSTTRLAASSLQHAPRRRNASCSAV
jgi:hypothetical protein